MTNKFLSLGCSSYQTAAKLVGFIQMTSGGTGILLMVLFGVMGRIYNPEGIPDHFWKFAIPTGMISVCSMSLALLLLDGVYSKSIFQVRLWLGILLVFLIVSVVGLSLALETEELFPLELKGLITVGIVLLGYLFLIVMNYQKVLKAELDNVHQRLPKLNNSPMTLQVNNSPDDNSSNSNNPVGSSNIGSGPNGININANPNSNNNHSNLINSLPTGIDENESRTRACTIPT